MPRKTGSADIYQLIHALTPAEQGYFRKYARRHSDNNTDYLKLFDAIIKMEAYDEPALKKKFKNLAVLKNYLFELILEALQISENDPSPINTILKGLIKINLLVKKGLRQKALKLITEYKDMAARGEYYHFIAYLLKMEFNLVRGTWKPTEALAKIKESRAAIEHAERKQKNADDFLNQNLISLSISLLQRNNDKVLPVDEWMDIAFITTPKNALSNLAEGARLSSLVGYYALKGDSKKLLAANRQYYLFEKKRWQDAKGYVRPDYYLNALNTYIGTSLDQKNTTLAAQLVEELRTVPLNASNNIFDNNLRYVFNRQNVLWAKGQHVEGATFTADALKKFSEVFKMPHYTGKLIKLVGKKAMFEFSTGEYKKALLTLQHFNASRIGEYSETDRKGAEFTNLLIQYEMGNYELIKGIIRSIRYRFKQLSADENQLLLAFAKYHHQPKQLYSHLQKNVPDLVILQSLFIDHWVQSKITRQPLSNVVRKNLSKN